MLPHGLRNRAVRKTTNENHDQYQRHHLSGVVPKWKSGKSVFDFPGYDHTEIFLLKEFTADQQTTGGGRLIRLPLFYFFRADHKKKDT